MLRGRAVLTRVLGARAFNEDAKALACHDALLGRLIEGGYVPYRLGIQSVRLLPEPEGAYGELLGKLKRALDPNNVLAPGRYGVGAQRPGEGP